MPVKVSEYMETGEFMIVVDATKSRPRGQFLRMDPIDAREVYRQLAYWFAGENVRQFSPGCTQSLETEAPEPVNQWVIP